MVYNWRRKVQRILAQAPLRGLWPAQCALCLAVDPSGRGLCEACRLDLLEPRPVCPRCAQTLPDADLPCGHCQRHPPRFDRAYALFPYAAPVDRLIQQLKFNAALEHARLFGLLLADALRDTRRPDLIVPVPLHPRRQRERGFNQAVEIARPVAAALGVRQDLSSCVRIRNSPPQASLDAHHRRRNLAKAFALHSPIKARRVALVDDVMTTGSTLNALAGLLREAGVEWIEVWVCARTRAPHESERDQNFSGSGL